ncbi:MAG: oligosaccharide flippase family protein [Proteobacteria bacterium]|nr:oligosaccharide flippase family protein [Pseudomonadota bacterium]
MAVPQQNRRLAQEPGSAFRVLAGAYDGRRQLTDFHQVRHHGEAAAPELFGLMNLSLMAIRGTQLITDTGFGPRLIQRKGDFDEAKNTAFTLLAIAVSFWLS